MRVHSLVSVRVLLVLNLNQITAHYHVLLVEGPVTGLLGGSLTAMLQFLIALFLVQDLEQFILSTLA